MKEEISALIDGEATALERKRILRDLQSDPALRDTWGRYHLARTALHRELDYIVHPGLSERIHARLQHEKPQASFVWPRTPQLLRYTAGLAIAASVAAVAILNLTPPLSPSTPSIAKSAPATSSKSTVADARRMPAEQQRALNPYLVQHGEFAPTPGMNGMLSYVRVVGHNGESANVSSNSGE